MDGLYLARQREIYLSLKLLLTKVDRILVVVEQPSATPISTRSASIATVMRMATLRRLGLKLLQWGLGRLAELLLPSLLVMAGLAWRGLAMLWRAIVG